MKNIFGNISHAVKNKTLIFAGKIFLLDVYNPVKNTIIIS